MPADEAPKGAEAVEVVARALCDHENEVDRNRDWEERPGRVIALVFEDWRDEYEAKACAALRADPLREYIRHMTERVECEWCRGQKIVGYESGEVWQCRECHGEGTVPRYQAEGGAEAFITTLREMVDE